MSHLGTVSQSWNEAESSTRAASCLPYWAMAPASYSKPSVESTWSWSSQGVDNLSHLLVLSGRRLEMVPFLVTTSRDRKTPEFLSLIPEIYEQTLDILFSIFADVVVDLIPLQIGAYFPLHLQVVCFAQ